MAKIKRPSNNPKGRSKIEDKKIMIGIYVRQSDITDRFADKDGFRSEVKRVMKLKD